MTEIWLESCFYVFHTMQRWEKLLGDPLLARISVSESTSYHMTALALVPDPMLLGTGPNYPPIQQVTENRGFNQIQKFFTDILQYGGPYMQCTNIFFQCTTYIYSVHKCISECTNLFLSAQINFSVHKSISQCTNVFLSARIYFSVQKYIFQYTNVIRSAQMYFH